MKNKVCLVSTSTLMLFNVVTVWGNNSKEEKPNVILIMTDDQGYGDLHCHGNAIIQTPHLDAMHDASVRFTDFHVNATSAPTRSALMTGRYARRVGVGYTVMGRQFLRTDETTIAEIFTANGYKTGLFGKWHLGQNYPLRPIDRGFQEMFMSGGGCASQMDDYWDNDRMNDYFNHNGQWELLEGYGADAMFTEALKFMGKSLDNPFFVYLPISEPHLPQNVLTEWCQPYLDAGLDKELSNFFATITRIDYNVGRLMQFLKEKKLDENTIIIFMTDNGTSSGSHYYNAGMRGRKGTMYEGGHRVPFFIKIPKKYKEVNVKPRDISGLSAHIDVLPTLAELCNLKYEYKNKLDGKSLVPLLQDTKNWEDRMIYLDEQRRHYPRKDLSYCMITNRWRLIDGKELYDIKKDPGQNDNVYNTYPEVVSCLKKAYNTYWDEFIEHDRVHYFTRVIVGSDKQHEVLLPAIDLFLENTDNLIVYQRTVRKGVSTNGCWFIEVEKDGLYEFELRRWPKELDKGIRDSIPEITSEQNDINLNQAGEKIVGVALDIVKARLSVNDHDVSCEVKEDDKKVVFEVPLKKGNATVRSWFYEANDKNRSAYYVYVRPKNF